MIKFFLAACAALIAFTAPAFAQATTTGFAAGIGGGGAFAQSDAAGATGSVAFGAGGQSGFARSSNSNGSANFAGSAIGVDLTVDDGAVAGGTATVTTDTIATSDNFSNSSVVTGGVGAGAALGFGTGSASSFGGGLVGAAGLGFWN